MDSQTATVKVYSPCDCEPCKAGQRWFYCRGIYHPGDWETGQLCDSNGRGDTIDAALEQMWA